MTAATIDLDAVRARFPALSSGIAFLDGPGGTQCPQSVIDAIGAYLRESNANLGAAFAASRRSDELVERAHATAARFLGCGRARPCSART
jgi:selenocysteine lyase/cysteine desulfurase